MLCDRSLQVSLIAFCLLKIAETSTTLVGGKMFCWLG